MSRPNAARRANYLSTLTRGGFTLPGAIHTSGIYPSSRLSESYVGQCWTPDQGGVYRVAGSGYGQVRGAKLATTVAEGAILGPELITNGGFDSDTWWAKNGTNTAITGGQAVVTNSDTSSNGVSRSAVVTVGSRYRITYTLVSISRGGFYPRIGSAGLGTERKTPGTYTEDIVCAGDTNLRLYGTVTGQSFKIDNVSVKEVIPVWIAPDTYPTRSIRTRFGTAKVPTGTDVGMVSSPAFTNKVTCRKTNPTDLTNVSKVGDASVVASLVNGVIGDFQNCKDSFGNTIDLSNVCSTYKYYRLVNGSAALSGLIFGGTCGNTNKHSTRLFVRGSGTLLIADSWSAVTLATITLSSVFTEVLATNWTPNNSGTQPYFRVAGGVTFECIMPELVESSYLPADPIVPLTAAADTLAAFTRAAVYAERNTAGVFPTVSVVETLAIGHVDNPYATQATRMSDGSVVPVVAGASWAQNFAVFGTCVPDAGGQGNLDVVSSRADTATYCDFIRTSAAGTFIRFQKIFAGTGTIIDVSYTHAANAPFDYLAIQTIHGMAIRVRPHATMTWSAWSTNTTTNGKKPAPIGTKYQIGAINGVAGIAGKHPKVSIFELGNQASLTAYQDRAMLLAGRITG